MSESIEAKVRRFIQFNQEMIAAAVADCNRQHQAIHAKVLLCAIIDSLAKSRFSNISANGERFIKTVEECSEWSDCDRVSLLHLKRALELIKEIPSEFCSLENWAAGAFAEKFRLNERLLSVRSPIAKDPVADEVLAYWPVDSANGRKRIGDIGFEKLQHKNLLWLYRNTLVHEYRIPGRGSELSAREEVAPYYQQVAKVEDIHPQSGLIFTKRWELVYPTGFFIQLSEEILQNVAAYHLKEDSSPFAAYSDGSYWIPRFNEEC